MAGTEKNQKNRGLPETRVLTLGARRGRGPGRWAGLLWGSGWLVGCAAPLANRDLNAYLFRGDFLEADKKVVSSAPAYGAKNFLLYHLDRALLLHWAGRFEESNQLFESAKLDARNFYTKSVTAGARTFLVNDLAMPYAGEDFERALIHVFSSLNYAALGRGEDALVECRQLDAFFRALPFDGQREAYRDDAFARYLAGLLYESEGEINDAYVSYVKALDAYDAYGKNYRTPRPPHLLGNALAMAQRLGFADKVRELESRRKEGDVTSPSLGPRDGEALVVHASGVGPEKVDSFFEISVYEGWPYVEESDSSSDTADVDRARAVFRSIAADQMVRMAFPKYRRHPSTIAGAEVTAGSATVRSVMVEDIGAIAVRGLEDRLVRTRGRAIARAVVKFLLAQKVQQTFDQKGQEGVGFLLKTLLQTAATITEVADKRSWRTLPDKIFLSRIPLPAGDHRLSIRFLDAAGSVIDTREAPAHIKPGKKTVIVVRTAV